MRKGELIPDMDTADHIIRSGRPLMFRSTVICAAQARSWTMGKLMKAIDNRFLYQALPNTI